MSNQKIAVCFFPGRETNYVRNRVLIKGMREAGLEVFDCSYKKKGIVRYIISFFRFLKYKGRCNIVFVGFMGQPLVPIVKIFTRKKIIFDAFISTYQVLAFDRKVINPHGFAAKIIRSFEKLSCRLADAVLLDTYQHINYYLNEYKLNKNKFYRSLLGSDFVSEPFPGTVQHNEIMIHFHGEFQAVHGTKYIIDAAKLLPDIPFRMIGEGRELEKRKKQVQELGLKNVIFLPRVPFSKIPQLIRNATICLGNFGETQKTDLVIPFKVYETTALGKPMITADSPAIKEIFTHKKDIYLCKPANANSLAQAIEHLLSAKQLRERIAENGLKTFREQCTPIEIGKKIRDVTVSLLNQKE